MLGTTPTPPPPPGQAAPGATQTLLSGDGQSAVAYNGLSRAQYNQGQGNTASFGGAGGVGSDLTTYRQAQAAQGFTAAAPGSLYRWTGPSKAQTTAAYNSIANRGAAQINSSAANPYIAQQQGYGTQGAQAAQGINQIQQNVSGVNKGLQATINGTAPSPADLQLQQGLNQNLSNQLAAARSQTGAGAALGAYGAANQGAAANLATNQQAAIQRAQETATAQGQLSQNLGLQGNLANTQAGIYGALGGQALQEAGAQQTLAQNQAQLQQGQQQYNQGVLAAGQGALSQNAVAQGNLGIAQGSNFETAQGIQAGVGTAAAALQGQEVGAGIGAGGAIGSTALSAIGSDASIKTDVNPAGSAVQLSPEVKAAMQPTQGSTASPNATGSGVGGQAAGAGIGAAEGAAAGAAGGGVAGAGIGAVPGAIIGGTIGALKGLFGARQQQQSAQNAAKAQSPQPWQEAPATPGVTSDVITKQDISPAGVQIPTTSPTGQPLPNIGGTPGSDSTAAQQQVAKSPIRESANPNQKQTLANPLGAFAGIGNSGLQAGQHMIEEFTPSWLPPPVSSDARLKVPSNNETDTDADAFLKALRESMATYRYKDPRDEPTASPTGGKYMGIMAQSLERVPQIGQQLVKQGPHGKVVEIPAALSAALAALGRIDQRLMGVEKRVGC